MTITVLYFAVVRELVGRDEDRLVLPEGVRTLEALSAHLASVHPALAGRLAGVRFARNEEFANLRDPVEEGDVVALIPPVAGG